MTAVPASWDRLLTALALVPALAGVRIEDGPWLHRPDNPDVIVIGWTPEEGASVDWFTRPAGLESDSEVFTLSGLVSAWSGDGVLKTVRDRADALLEAIRTELHRDPTVGGVVSRANLVTVAGTPYQTDQGCQFAIEFAIQFSVF